MIILKQITLQLLRLITPRSKAGVFNDKKTVFILTSGRTGTKFFGNYLNQHPDVYAVHEPKPSWRLRMWTVAYLEGDVDKEEMRRVLYNMRYKTMQSVKEAYYIESNPFLAGFADVIPDVFIGATLVQVIRDPRDYVTSSFNHGSSQGAKGMLNRILPYWHIDAKKLGYSGSSSDLAVKVASYCVHVNNYLTKSSAKFDKAFILKYEDLFFSKDDEILYKFLSDIGIDAGMIKGAIRSNERVNKSSKMALSSWRNWSNEQAQTINNICADFMNRNDYGKEEEWLKKLTK